MGVAIRGPWSVVGMKERQKRGVEQSGAERILRAEATFEPLAYF